MANCCKTNTCVELIPSACVRYTGTPTVGGLIDKQDYCDPYLNEIITLFDDNLTSLDIRVGLNKVAFDNINQACGLNDVINTSGLTVKNDKYYSSEVVIELVRVICELRSRINYLTTKNINTNSGNLHWEDMLLSDEFIAWLSNNACFSFDKPDCSNAEVYDKTLGGLLKAIIIKLCKCCP
jgi:hypothetical protein